ncbi:hypothetical protein IPdc08_01597 [archaeon]|nr:hypothetical protein IPdc08_01597 [archaeon]
MLSLYFCQIILIEFASLSDIALLTFERITAGLAKSRNITPTLSYSVNYPRLKSLVFCYVCHKKMGTLGLEPRSAGFSRENRLEPAMIAATLCPRIA